MIKRFLYLYWYIKNHSMDRATLEAQYRECDNTYETCNWEDSASASQGMAVRTWMECYERFEAKHPMKAATPNESQYLAALADVQYFNSDAQAALDKARAAGYGAGMQVGVEPKFVQAYEIVQAYENRNWLARRFGTKTEMVELV